MTSSESHTGNAVAMPAVAAATPKRSAGGRACGRGGQGDAEGERRETLLQLCGGKLQLEPDE